MCPRPGGAADQALAGPVDRARAHRSPDRPAQPPCLDGAPATRVGPHATAPRAAVVRHGRHRPFQAGQRQVRAPRGRQDAPRGGPGHRPTMPRSGSADPIRRRRIRGDRPRRNRGRGDASGGTLPAGSRSGLRHRSRRSGEGDREFRRGRCGGPDLARGTCQASRRGPVFGQARGRNVVRSSSSGAAGLPQVLPEDAGATMDATQVPSVPSPSGTGPG